MAIGKAAKWMPFATPQQASTSASVAHDDIHSTVSIADEKQFGFENVRDLRLAVPFSSFDDFILRSLPRP
jgi:hypothetical protein